MNYDRDIIYKNNPHEKQMPDAIKIVKNMYHFDELREKMSISNERLSNWLWADHNINDNCLGEIEGYYDLFLEDHRSQVEVLFFEGSL